MATLDASEARHAAEPSPAHRAQAEPARGGRVALPVADQRLAEPREKLLPRPRDAVPAP